MFNMFTYVAVISLVYFEDRAAVVTLTGWVEGSEVINTDCFVLIHMDELITVFPDLNMQRFEQESLN